jgi:hypothetical protein
MVLMIRHFGGRLYAGVIVMAGDYYAPGYGVDSGQTGKIFIILIISIVYKYLACDKVLYIITATV